VWDTAKISGRFACRHCLCSDFGAELGEPALDLGRDRRELLGARTELVHQLSGELGVLVEQLGGVVATNAAFTRARPLSRTSPATAYCSRARRSIVLKPSCCAFRTGANASRAAAIMVLGSKVRSIMVFSGAGVFQWTVFYTVLYALQEKHKDPDPR